MKAMHPTPCLPPVDNRQAKSPPKPGRSRHRWWWLPLLWLGGLMTPLAAQQDGDFTYFNDGASIAITGYTGAGGAVTIPDTIAGMPVRAISGFYGKTAVTSVTIPGGVAIIGHGAFESCTNLASVAIPDSVTVIGKYAFAFCVGLTSVSIPDSVTTIGDYAFHSSTGLTSVIIPDSVTSIGNQAFENCTELTSVTFGNGVTFIDNFGFSDLPNLTSVTLGSGLAYINSAVFRGCTSLLEITVAEGNSAFSSLNGVLFNKSQTELWQYPAGRTGDYTIPDSVIMIFPAAFSGCTGLTSVTIPDSVTFIGYGAFSGCTSLLEFAVAANNSAFTSPDGVLFNKNQTELWQYPARRTGDYTIPDSVIEIFPAAFSGCTGLTSVTIPDSVAFIGGEAFSGCTGLTSVTIPDSVTSIENYAFSGCTGLSSITIPGRVESIGYRAFSGCAGLTGVTIPDSVAFIGGEAFSGCTGLTVITLPCDVTRSGRDVFSGCTGLASLIFGDRVTYIPEFAFGSLPNLTSITLGGGVNYIDSDAFHGCTSLLEFIVAANNTTFSSLNGVLFDKNQTELLKYPAGRIGGYTIPKSVTRIEAWAFVDCAGLTSVTVPGSVMAIGEDAFIGCRNLASVLWMGNAPYINPGDNGWSFGRNTTMYYFEDRTGFNSGRWMSYRVVALTPFDLADDAFNVLAITAADAGKFALVTFGKEGRTYQLQRRADLAGAAPWTLVITAGPLTEDQVLELADADAPAGQAFYRVVVVAP